MVTRRSLAAGLVLAALFRPEAAPGQDHAVEYAVKATYLYKFAPFVQWPESALADAPGFEICVVGQDPFGPVLDDAVRGEQVRGGAISVRRLGRIADVNGCRVVFAGGSPAQSVAEILRALDGEPVLTVTDGALTREGKGIIHFVLHEDRVRFEIDDQAAARNGLTISSKVLSLALAVTPRT